MGVDEPTTILRWIRKFGIQHAQPPEPETDTAVVLELDEMWHYLKKNESCGFGKLCVVIQENSSPGSVVIGIKKP